MFTSDTASGIQLPVRVQAYIEALTHSCAQDHVPLVSVVLFGSAAKGGFSAAVSDVDVIIVVSDDTSRAKRLRLLEDVARLETVHELRPATVHRLGRLRTRIERAVGHGFSCFVCTRSDLLSGNVAPVLNLRPWEALFVDRIVYASIVASAVSVWGEDLVPRVSVPSVRRFDVFKALCGFSGQVVSVAANDCGLMIAGTIGLLSALAARGSLGMRLMSIAIITKNGTLASGSRTSLRATLSWLPVLAASAAAFAGHSPLLMLTPQGGQFLVISPMGLPIFFPNNPSILIVRLSIITVALAVFALAGLVALIKPERGLQDRLAGTWLMPR